MALEHKITSEMIGKIDPSLSRGQLASLEALLVPIEDLYTENYQKNKERIRMLLQFDADQDRPRDYGMIGKGKDGIIIFSAEKYIIKVSADALKEYELLQRIDKCHNSSQRHIVKALGIDESNTTLRLEFVNGPTIKSMIMNHSKMPADQVMDLGRQILDGIWEMRYAGVCHRDLHDGNVVVALQGHYRGIIEWIIKAVKKDYYSSPLDICLPRWIAPFSESKGKVDAVDENYRYIRGFSGEVKIIDFSSATTDLTECIEGDRKYGSNNDLIAVGQMMFRMATGYHLFYESKMDSWSSDLKNPLMQVRISAYKDRGILEGYFTRVREKLNPQLSDAVITLLDDNLNKQPSMERIEDMQKMFASKCKI